MTWTKDYCNTGRKTCPVPRHLQIVQHRLPWDRTWSTKITGQSLCLSHGIARWSIPDGSDEVYCTYDYLLSLFCLLSSTQKWKQNCAETTETK
jgi:hypothetical protein